MRVTRAEHPWYTLEHNDHCFDLTYFDDETRVDRYEFTWAIDSDDGSGFIELMLRYNMRSIDLAEMIQDILNKEIEKKND